MSGWYNFNSCNLVKCAADWNWRAGPFKDYDIWLVMAGTGRLESCDGNVYTISRGDCFVFYPGSSHYATHLPSDPLQVVAIHFDINDEAKVKSFAYHRKLSKSEFIIQLLTRSAEFGRAGDMTKADFWLNAGLQAVLEYDSENDRKTHNGNYHLEAIEDLCRTIQTSPGSKYNIRKLAQQNGLCHDHFSRIFREIKGCSPQEFIIKCRMEQAKELLTGSSMPIGRIAEELGYSSLYFFSRQFTERIGITPSQFRKS